MLLEMGVGVPQRTWIAFPSNFKRRIRLQDAANTSGLCQTGLGSKRNWNIPEIPLVLHAFKAWVQQALGGKQAIKKLMILILGKKIVVT